MQTIPKIVHMTWKSKDVLDNQSPVILNGLRNLIDMNPDWRLEISDDEDLEIYLRNNLYSEDYKRIKHRGIVEKSDLWRLLKIYNEGGMYIDIDRHYNIPMRDVLDPDTTMLLPTNQDFDFSQDFMCSAPGNPMFQRAIEFNLYLRRNGETRIYLLGAQGYMLSLTSCIMDGVMISSDPGAETFDKIRLQLERIPGVKTYRENPPNDTMIFRFDPNTWQHGNGKDKLEFYREFGVRHWVNNGNNS